MFPWPRLEGKPTLKDVLKLAAVIVAAGALLAAVVYLADRFGPADGVNQELLERHRADLEAQVQALQARSQTLEDELMTLSAQLDVLEEEVRLSIEAREEAHDAVDGATSIDDIDAVLKRGIRGASGRRGP